MNLTRPDNDQPMTLDQMRDAIKRLQREIQHCDANIQHLALESIVDERVYLPLIGHSAPSVPVLHKGLRSRFQHYVDISDVSFAAAITNFEDVRASRIASFSMNLRSQIRRASSKAVREAAAKLQAAINEEVEDDFEAVVDTLETHTSLDHYQVEQCQLHAAMRRALKANYELRGAQEFLELAPGLCTDTNASRGLSRMAEAHTIIGMKEGSRWIYPVCQLDPKRCAVFPDLIPVIRKSAAEGYTAWEILYWLVTPPTIEDPYEGQSVDTGEAFDADAFIGASAQRSAEANTLLPPKSPLALLNEGDGTGFKKLADNWLDC